VVKLLVCYTIPKKLPFLGVDLSGLLPLVVAFVFLPFPPPPLPSFLLLEGRQFFGLRNVAVAVAPLLLAR